MVVPIFGECTYIVNVDFCIFKVAHDILHYWLSDIRGALESHREPQVFVLAKRRNNGTKVRAFFIKLKCIVLHTNIKFWEKLIAWSLFQNIRYNGQWILPSFNNFVKRTQIGNPPYSAILFRGNECGWSPLTFLLTLKDSYSNKMIKLFFESLEMNPRHRVCPSMYWFSIRIDVYVYFLVRVYT